jgi:hypothetical protein
MFIFSIYRLNFGVCPRKRGFGGQVTVFPWGCPRNWRFGGQVMGIPSGRPQKVGVLWTGSGSDLVPGTKTGKFVDGARKTTTPQVLLQGNRWR